MTASLLSIQPSDHVPPGCAVMMSPRRLTHAEIQLMRGMSLPDQILFQAALLQEYGHLIVIKNIGAG